jgi:hypothetical protein
MRRPAIFPAAMDPAARLYARYATLLLALTLAAGVYLRAAFTWPAVRGPLDTPFVIHAHSHAGFFGWMVMGIAAALLLRGRAASTAAGRAHRTLAHAIGIASGAAFIGFALRGYDTATIVLSALHVGMWAALVALLWRRTDDPVLRAGLAFLILAGAGAIVPVVVMVRGVTDPWLVQLAVQLFLTPFVNGFLLLSAIGLAYPAIPRVTSATPVAALIAAGTLPSTFLYVPGTPGPWLVLAGRAGIGLVGAGLALFAIDAAVAAVRARRGPPPLIVVSVLSAAVVAVVMLLAAAGVGTAFMHNRTIAVALLHLVLLGVVTPVLAAALRPGPVAPIRTALFGMSLALMLAPLAAAGWPWALRALLQCGIGPDAIAGVAAAGGLLTALSLLSLMPPGRMTAAGPDTALADTHAQPARTVPPNVARSSRTP